MAFTFLSAIGKGASNTSGLMASLVTTYAVPVGSLVVACIAKNASMLSGTDTWNIAEVVSVSDQLNNGWIEIGERRSAGGATAVAAMWACRVKTAMPVGTVIKATFDGNVPGKAMLAMAFAPAANTVHRIYRLGQEGGTTSNLGFGADTLTQLGGVAAPLLHVHMYASVSYTDLYTSYQGGLVAVDNCTGGSGGVLVTASRFAETATATPNTTTTASTTSAYKGVIQATFIEVPVPMVAHGMNF